jgi:hypothetical protein
MNNSAVRKNMDHHECDMRLCEVIPSFPECQVRSNAQNIPVVLLALVLFLFPRSGSNRDQRYSRFSLSFILTVVAVRGTQFH